MFANKSIPIELFMYIVWRSSGASTECKQARLLSVWKQVAKFENVEPLPSFCQTIFVSSSSGTRLTEINQSKITAIPPWPTADYDCQRIQRLISTWTTSRRPRCRWSRWIKMKHCREISLIGNNNWCEPDGHLLVKNKSSALSFRSRSFARVLA